MKITEDMLVKINELNTFIIEWCDHFEDYESDLIFSVDRIAETIGEEDNEEEIIYEFPGDDEYMELSIEELLKLSDDLKTIKIESNSLIKTDLKRYYIVKATDSDDDYFLKEYHEIQLKPQNGINVNLTNDSFIVALAATKLKAYDEDYGGTINQYLAIEIIYENTENILSASDEKKLIDSYIFELADSTNIALRLSEIKNPSVEFEELREEAELNYTGELRDLEPFNEGMRLFVSAVQIEDQELKFFNFYKVLEHFSPIAVNIEANELMRKKLDSPKSSFENGDFIRSIFELANSMRDKFNDEDLIKAAFISCFDFIGIHQLLPETIKKQISKHLGGQELEYSTDRQKITTSCNIAAKIIYKTRNRIVHAKSNFAMTGEEIKGNEMEQLNAFMKEASSQAIRWYNRQPKHMQLEIIK
jgi:hypothetical protein